LAPIRDGPRYRDLLKRLKLDVYFPEKPGEMKRPDDKVPTGGNT
jgi:hypothetical protein